MSKLASFRFNTVDSIASHLMGLTEPPGSFDTLTANQRVVVHVWNAVGLIGNVGIKEFLGARHNSEEVASAFSAIGENTVANAIREAARILLTPEDPNADDKLNGLESIIYRRDDEIEAALFAFMHTTLYPQP